MALPTTGLDPASRHALWDIVRGLVRDGSTVLLTTQYLDEADALAGLVVFLDDGQVVAAGTPADLKLRAGQAQVDLIAATEADFVLLTGALSAFTTASDASRRTVRVAVHDRGTSGIREISAITAAALRAGARIERFSLHEPDLDDLYFQLTGRARPGLAEGAA